MNYSVAFFFALFTFNSFGAALMNLSCEGHTAFRKKVCQIQVSVDPSTADADGNLFGTGTIKCNERGGKIINESKLNDFCYSGQVDGNFLLEARSEIKPFEVPAQKAMITIDISSSAKKVKGVANYFNGTVFKDMSIKCEYK